MSESCSNFLPDDPENPTGKRKMRRRESRHQGRHRSKQANAIATSMIVLNLPEFLGGTTRIAGSYRAKNLPEFAGKDLSEFAETFGRLLSMTSQTNPSGRVKYDLLLQNCKTK